MTEPDQCIICLESLQHPSLQQQQQQQDVAAGNVAGPAAAKATAAATTTTVQPTYRTIDSDLEILEEPESNYIATLVGCNHVVHDQCIRSWAKNSNTCPICRTPFNEVSLSSELNGPPIDSYAVQDKKQEQEFDIHRWLQENPEGEGEEPSPACPICESSDHEEVLLLCDGCNAAYHTHCIGLSGVPQTESWYCFECDENNNASRSSPSEASDVEVIQSRPLNPAARSANRRNVTAQRGLLRTQLQARNARREARSLEWQGAWDRIASRIYDATDIDLDNHEDEDLFQGFRRAQAQRGHFREIQEHQDWEQRMSIASRLGARDIFARNIRPTVGHRLDGGPVEPVMQPLPPAPETREEQQAWGALERAREAETSAPNPRKRKSRSTTASPQEPAQEPERKLKRPRTRRLPLQGEGSGSGSASASVSGSASGSGSGTASGVGPTIVSALAPAPTITSSPAPTSVLTSRPQTNGATQRVQSPINTEPGPSFLSSLLKEVEMSAPSDDETVRNYFGTHSGVDPSSPVTSPSPSSRNSPRALSLTPPPHPRPSSPTLSLSSYVEPRFPKANYSPTRNAGDSSDSDSRSNGAEIRQPRPQRPNRQRPTFARSQDSSPTRSAIPFETKERISGIVRAALKPHWRAKELTTDQYANINRDVSRKLYEGLRDPQTLDDDAKKTCEKIATKEVARAIEELKA
ncbi:PHD-finger domain-containing protein [Colletotrichum limetticola]|uniref:PHD-finger domain-containing protein n=1 Tax=Colletotrichum limetticola TaxID=1209924 RepID=A0ABQ9PBB7_9PEZI|nr:PHD-finger domain-containing protein [Colletotrichum limetticola]